MLLAALLEAAAAGLVIWFSAAFAEAIREREERSDVHMALLAGSVLIGGAIFTYAVGLGVLGYVALVAAGISVLAGFSIFFDSGIYAPGGSVMPFVSLTAGGITVACASFFMVREHLPEVTPMRLPQT